jgi:hypothetical protein
MSYLRKSLRIIIAKIARLASSPTEKIRRSLLVFSSFGLALQIVHLYWLTETSLLPLFFSSRYVIFPGILVSLFVLADFIEIPAIITRTYLYAINYKNNPLRNIAYVFLLNTQWFHIFWITDTYVINNITGIYWSFYLSLLAIVIDYFEIPVILDTLIELFFYKKKKNA